MVVPMYVESVSPGYPGGEGLVGCCDPLPAQERARKREALLAATEAGLERIAREAARRTRDPVAPANPAARTRHEKASRRTDDGTPLHRLDTLLGELATRCRNTCRVPADPSAPPLSLLTEPTPTQRRAANLIGSFPVPGTSES